MSGLDGVSRRPGPSGPGGPHGPKKTGESKRAEGDFEASLDPSAPPEAVEGAGGVGPRFSSLRQRILEGVDEEQSKDEILRAVIDDEVQHSFGREASPRMTASIAQAFDDNEDLKALFNRLYGHALRERGGA